MFEKFQKLIIKIIQNFEKVQCLEKLSIWSDINLYVKVIQTFLHAKG